MTQYIIIGIIIAVAAAYAIKRIRDTFNGKSDCGCGSGTHCHHKKGFDVITKDDDYL